jgi:hypothetical protein
VFSNSITILFLGKFRINLGIGDKAGEGRGMTLERAFHPIETIARLKLQQHPKGG